MSKMFDMDGPDLVPAPDGSQRLPLGTWTRDSLLCSAGRCERIYKIDVLTPGTLSVDVYAPVGDGLPDCNLSLETEAGSPLKAQKRRTKAQRRLRYRAASAGTYRLRVTSKGASKDLFDYEVVAEVHAAGKPEPTIPIARTERVPGSESSAKPRPDVPYAKDPKPTTSLPRKPDPIQPSRTGPPVREVAVVAEKAGPPAPVWLTSEVLDVEETSGRPSAVMLEAGTPDGIVPGMRGELFEGDKIIGRIEIVDVYPTGSRAKILGSLSAPVSFDTYSRIELPPQAPTTSGE